MVTKRIFDLAMKVIDWVGIKKINMAEFGAQTVCNDLYQKFGAVTAKDLFVSKGYQHTSFDLNGKHGSLVVNLGKGIPQKFFGKFNVVTNFGTIEHIKNDSQAFLNSDQMCAKGGVILHCLPHYNGDWLENHKKCLHVYNTLHGMNFFSIYKPRYSFVHLEYFNLWGNPLKPMIFIGFQKWL